MGSRVDELDKWRKSLVCRNERQALIAPHMNGDSTMVADRREPLEIRISVLATKEQALALQELIGEAICGAPLDHDGPCRVAWGAYVATELSQKERKDIREELDRVETWHGDEVDRSLGIGDAIDR